MFWRQSSTSQKEAFHHQDPVSNTCAKDRARAVEPLQFRSFNQRTEIRGSSTKADSFISGKGTGSRPGDGAESSCLARQIRTYS